jgi:hypothetical protein
MTQMPLALSWSTFWFWVAVSVVAGLLVVLLVASGRWLTGHVRAWWKRRQKARDLRVVFIDIRSELGSGRRVLQQAAEQQLFWNPELEQVPGQRWDDHRQRLAEEQSIEPIRAAIEEAYQQCNRLNQHVRDRVDEDSREREADPSLSRKRDANWGRSFEFYSDDKDVVQAAISSIDTAMGVIDAYLEGR